jgi:Leucine-rich repeat (LRR) protein
LNRFDKRKPPSFMTPEERDYEEAKRRILKAKENKSVELVLSKLSDLTRFPPELAKLISLQSLDLSDCGRLSGDLSPLAALTSLQSLNLSYCLGVRRFAPLESLLPSLKELSLFGCKLEDLPPEVCGESPYQNVLDKVRAHLRGHNEFASTLMIETRTIDDDSLSELRQAYRQKNLTLYLGAGVSLASGLPSWDQLVLTMYYGAISTDWKARWRPYPNYLYAIAEWQLNRGHEPLEITARKIRQCYKNDAEFVEELRSTLYAGFAQEGPGFWQYPNIRQLREGNPTLDGVAELCDQSQREGT